MSVWPYRSHKELAAAGYKQIAITCCKLSPCAEIILIYRTPDKKTMSVDRVTYMTHFSTCRGYGPNIKKAEEEKTAKPQGDLFEEREPGCDDR